MEGVEFTMAGGCALVVVIFLVLLFISSLATIPETGVYGLGFTVAIGYVIYLLLIKPMIEETNKKKSEKPTGHRPSNCIPPPGRPAGSGDSGSKDEDDMLDVAIAAGLTYSLLSDNSGGNDDHNDLDDEDKDDWDTDDKDLDDDDWDDW